MRPDAEVPLSRGAVRVGATVWRPLKPGAQFDDLLDHFEREGFDGAPRYCGIDSQGREILSYIHGFTPPHNGFELSEEAVAAGARLLRRVHDLTERTEFAAGAEVACHPNLSQPNFVFREMTPVAIIDWDGTRPTWSATPTSFALFSANPTAGSALPRLGRLPRRRG